MHLACACSLFCRALSDCCAGRGQRDMTTSMSILTNDRRHSKALKWTKMVVQERERERLFHNLPTNKWGHISTIQMSVSVRRGYLSKKYVVLVIRFLYFYNVFFSSSCSFLCYFFYRSRSKECTLSLPLSSINDLFYVIWLIVEKEKRKTATFSSRRRMCQTFFGDFEGTIQKKLRFKNFCCSLLAF